MVVVQLPPPLAPTIPTRTFGDKNTPIAPDINTLRAAYDALLAYVAQLPTAIGSGDFFAQQRAQAIFWLNDPIFNGGMVLNNPAMAAHNSACFDAVMSLVGDGAVVKAPVGALYHNGLAITKSNVVFEGVGPTGMRSHEYSTGILKGCQTIFVGTGNAITIQTNDPAVDYLAGVVLRDFGISTDKFGQAGRDSATVGVYIGQSDNTILENLSITQIGVSVKSFGADTPKLLNLWLCEAGAGIEINGNGLETGHTHIKGCTIADQGGKTGIGPNRSFGIRLLNTFHTQIVGNTFARNQRSIWSINSTDSTIGLNNFKEVLAQAIYLDASSTRNNITGGSITQAALEAMLIEGTYNYVAGVSTSTVTTTPNIKVTGNYNFILDNPTNVGVQNTGIDSVIRLLGGALSTGSGTGANGVATPGTYFEEDSQYWIEVGNATLERSVSAADRASYSGGNFYYDNTNRGARAFKLQGTGFEVVCALQPNACTDMNVKIYPFDPIATDGGASKAVSYGTYSLAAASTVPADQSTPIYSSLGRGPALDTSKIYMVLITPQGAGTPLWDGTKAR